MPRPANALNNEMENFMSSSGDAGVIIVSFGTMVSALEPEVMNMLADTFAQLKQKILWRIKGKFRCLNPYIFKYFLAFIQCLLVFSPHRFTVLLFFIATCSFICLYSIWVFLTVISKKHQMVIDKIFYITCFSCHSNFINKC